MNPILQGLLLGTGQGAGAIAGARKEQEDKALRDKQLGFQERQVTLAEQAAKRDVDDRDALSAAAGAIPELAPHAPLLAKKGGLDIVKMLGDLNAKKAEKAAELADRQGIADVVREAAGTPPTPAEIAPDVPVANGMDSLMNILMPGRAPMPMNDVRPKLARYGKEGRETFKEMYPQDSYAGVGLDQDLVNKTTGEVVRPGTPKPVEPKMQNAANIIDSLTQEYHALRDSGVPETDRRVKNLAQRINNQKLVAQQEGGAIIGPMGPVSQAPPKTQPLPAGQASELADARSFVSMLNEVERIYDPKYTGPVQGRLGWLKSMTVGTPERETEMRTLISSFENQLLRARSGMAVTPQEYDRIKAELPQANDPDSVFPVKLRTARRLMEEAIGRREESFTQRGFRGGDAPAQPGDKPLVRVSETKDAPQTFKDLPSAAQFKGREIENPQTKQVLRSDGAKWVPVGR